MWWPIHPRGADLDVEAAHHVGCLPTWLIGYVIPLTLAAIGIWSIVERRSVIPGRWSHLEIHGAEAVAFGVGLASTALALHAKVVWATTRGLWRVADGVVVVALIGVAGGFGYIVFAVAVRMFS